MLYGYGAYGISMDPWFSVARLSLLDRGSVFAVAHVRGGSELGRPWYDDGRMAHKHHTFEDFAAAADHLVAQRYVDPDRLAGEGGSAGGLLIGAVANDDRGRFRALHAQVPFVDVLTTMLDPDLPLTAGEWEEWGDPIDRRRGLPVDQGVLALRQRRRPRLPGAPGDDEHQRHPGLRHRAGQVGGPAARPRDQRPGPRPDPVPHVDDRRAHGPVGPLRRLARDAPGSSPTAAPATAHAGEVGRCRRQARGATPSSRSTASAATCGSSWSSSCSPGSRPSSPASAA